MWPQLDRRFTYLNPRNRRASRRYAHVRSLVRHTGRVLDEDSTDKRKRLRLGHVSERGAVNAVRTLLEAHGMVVDQVDGRSDYGRDLNVDITMDGELSGIVIGVQVKGDRRFIREDDWELPMAPRDRRCWAESSVPIVGILWDPETHEMRWSNLTAEARADPAISTWTPGSAPKSAADTLSVRFPKSTRLASETVAKLVAVMSAYVRQYSAPALLGLFDDADDRRCQSVFDCWTVGRSDARAFLLLRQALPVLSDQSLRFAIERLSYLTPHPDIFWNTTNWVPPEIKRRVQGWFRWSAQEVYDLVSAVEHQAQAQESGGWQRGELGQCLWCLLVEDPNLRHAVLPALGLALDADDLDTAFRLLVMHQCLADHPFAAVQAALALYPEVAAHPLTGEFVGQVETFGFSPLL